MLTDVERIAPALPGAQLQEIEGDEYRGIVKVKVGPITAQYKGKATFVEKDDANHKAVLKAEGRDTKGQGNASALITATLVPDGEGTKVTVHTDLTVTGKVAQFGRGVMADVSAKLLDQFVDHLESTVLAGDAARGEPGRRRRSPSACGDHRPTGTPVPAADAGAAPTIRRLDIPSRAGRPGRHGGRAGRQAGRAARDRRAARPAPRPSACGAATAARASTATVNDVAAVAALLGRAPALRFRGRRPPRRRLAGGDPQRAAPRRRHADADRATGSSAARAGAR